MNITGTSGNDSLTGTSVDDFIRGLAGNDTLTGLAGNDTLDAGTGGDRLIGGTGNDTYIVDGPGDTVIENAGQGIDTVRTSASRTLDTNVENLTLTGSAAINGTGNSLNNVITGNTADNVLNGGTGADRLVGGQGWDTYIVDGPGDVVVESSLIDSGFDTVLSSATRTLEANVENLTLTGSAAINGTGNSLANTIVGNNAANTLAGGAGNDRYHVGAGDRVVENSGQGHDTVLSPLTWTLGANLESLELTGSAPINGTGNSLNNNLIGNTSANVLSGGDGDDRLNGGFGGLDTLNGGFGNDVYHFTGVEVLSDPGGVDEVFTEVSWTLVPAIENARATDAGPINLTGNSGSNLLVGNFLVNVLTGGDGNDTLQGHDGNDTLSGGAGRDRLEGRFRNDSLTGGSGRDYFVFLDTPVVEGVDRITDFVRGTDELLFENGTLTALGASGALAAGDGRFRSGSSITTGQDSSDRLIYNTTTDSLYYDPDGSGSAGSQLIATFAGNPTLSASDITII